MGLLTAHSIKDTSAEHKPSTTPRSATLAPSGQRETMTSAKNGLAQLEQIRMSLMCLSAGVQPIHLTGAIFKEGKRDAKIQPAAR